MVERAKVSELSAAVFSELGLCNLSCLDLRC